MKPQRYSPNMRRNIPFIKVIRRDDRGFRKLGGGVIDAFYHGYDTINPNDFEISGPSDARHDR